MTYSKSRTLTHLIAAFVVVAAIAVLSWLTFAFAQAGSAKAEETEQSDIATQADAQPSHDSVFGANHDHEGITPISAMPADKYLPTGTYYLTDDVVLTDGLEMLGKSVSICLHGHTLSSPKDHVFEIYGSEGALNIYDCGGTGTITSGRRNGVYLFNHATLNMYGGTIKSCPDSGVSVAGGSIINMYGGVITENTSSGNSGGVAVWSGGTFNMYGGTISNNTTTKYYGGAGVDITSADSVFRMYGGSIINNVLDCGNASEEDLALFYKGAGVDFGAGAFSMEGNVVISGNVRKVGASQVINNLELRSDYKLIISGKLGANARVGITAKKGVFTSGYSAAGNTANPSEYFKSDDGATVGFDDLRKEAAITSGSDADDYDMKDAKVIGAAAAKVGDKKVTFTIEVTLKSKSGNADKNIEDIKTVTLKSPLRGGDITVTFEYTYNGVSGPQSKELSYTITPAKLRVYVTWSGIGSSGNSATRDYDGNNTLGDIKASYTGYDGEKKEVVGTSAGMIAKDSDGKTVNSTAAVGEYRIYLAPSDDYEFDNNLFTLTVVAHEEDGYYQMIDASFTGVFGAPKAGDKSFTAVVERKLKHTKDQPDKTDKVNYTVNLDTALKVGNNTVKFEYKYVDMKGGVQTKQLTATVTAAKKSVTVKWYFNSAAVSGKTINHVYDGEDIKNKIVAEYDGVDGTKQRVNGTSAAMLKTDKDGNAVTALKEVGEYTVSLASAADYEFGNNSLTVKIVEQLSDIAELISYEGRKPILGVSCNGNYRFEKGTELNVEKVTDYNPNVVSGEVKTAYSVKFIKDSVEIHPTGTVTVHVLIPEELRNGNCMIYHLGNNGVAIPITFTKDGNFAVFESDELNCILFVEDKNAPPINDDPDDPDDPIGDDPIGDDPTQNDPISGDGSDIRVNDAGFEWLWVVVALLVAGGIILVAALIAKKKSNKK